MGQCTSFQFKLEYQKGANNGAADILSWVPISHSQETIQFLLEGAIVGVANRGEATASKKLLGEHEHLCQEARVQVVKLEPMCTIPFPLIVLFPYHTLILFYRIT